MASSTNAMAGKLSPASWCFRALHTTTVLGCKVFGILGLRVVQCCASNLKILLPLGCRVQRSDYMGSSVNPGFRCAAYTTELMVHVSINVTSSRMTRLRLFEGCGFEYFR